MARSSSAKNGKNSKNTYRASGSKSSKSSSSGTRHNSSASGSKKRMSRLEQRRAQQQNLIRSVVLAGLGILAIALVLVPGQSFWNVLRSWLFGTFGVVTYFVGPFLLYLAYLLASGYHVGTFIGKVLLLAVLLVQRRWMLFFAAGTFFARIPLVFLTAPDTYFMYYLTPFIAGYAVAAAAVLYAVLKRKLKSERITG